MLFGDKLANMPLVSPDHHNKLIDTDRMDTNVHSVAIT